MIQVWSCGGGTQSAAIAALIIQGKLLKPDISLIVDTNREKSGTWDYMDNVLSPALAKIGVEIVRVDKSQYATVDLYSTNDENLLMPVFSTQDGAGKLSNYCSYEWKRRVMMRWLRDGQLAKQSNGKNDQCEVWLGISTDEISRVRAGDGWMRHRYPLIFDVPMNRQDCINLVLSMGWPEPPRSSCWMCPNMRDGEWREMKENYPDDFRKAVELEREIRLRDPHAWLHESCKPLDEVDFTNYQSGFSWDKGCSSGHCFT